VVVQSNLSAATATIELENEGVTPVEVSVTDMAGNTYGPTTIDVRIDLTAPTGSFGPVDSVYYVGHFTPTWSGTDGNGSGVFAYLVEYKRGNALYSVLLNGTTLTQTLFNATDGDYSFRLTVFDMAGRASPPAALDVVFALLGSMRVRVLDPNGAAIANTSVFVEGVNVTLLGQGDLEITGLPAGNYTVVIQAPGYREVRRQVTITARQTADLGEVVMQEEGTDLPVEVVALWGLLAGVALATVVYWAYLKQKWSGKRPGPPKAP
jgi:hypothetical protein